MKQQHDEVTSVCEECGASVYQQHLASGIARYEGGRLLCAPCVTEYEKSHDAAAGGMTEDLAPIELEGDDDRLGSSLGMSSSRIHGVTEATLGKGSAKDESQFKRPLRPDLNGATRCRTFHCRLSEGAVEFMNSQVNEWLDSHENIAIKFATTTIGQFEGKHTEPNLIITLFY